jgi:hypothetical protein
MPVVELETITLLSPSKQDFVLTLDRVRSILLNYP